MLQLSDIFKDRKILSLRTGGPIGYASIPVINPNNLKIEGWFANANGSKDPMILPAIELRDIIAKGLVVNDHTSLTEPDDLVRMKEFIEMKYEVIGKIVATENGKKIGKIQDYAVDSKSMYIQKIYVNPSLMRGLSIVKQQLIIDRNQVIEITDKKIIVKEPTEKVRAQETATVPAS